MKTAEKNRSSTRQNNKPPQPFFNRSGKDSFFSSNTLQAKVSIGEPNDKYEQEANAMANQIIEHKPTSKIQEKTSQPTISKFSDSGHHLIEEYALPRAGLDAAGIAAIKQANTAARRNRVKQRYGLTDEQIDAVRESSSIRAELRFTREQIAGIHQGNTQRDYSQVPRIGNSILLNNPSTFGGYSPEEHFDNFRFSIQEQRWRSRSPSRRSRPDPIAYISSQLRSVTDNWDNPRLSVQEKMVWVGNAFHAVEDFFAHSNFVELIQGDMRHGEELITGSVGDIDSTVSISHILADVSTPEMREYYERIGRNATSRTPEGSHSRMAKDVPHARNYGIARRLAALVIQQISTDLLIALHPNNPGARFRLLQSTLMQKLNRYLRPPSENDKWWETLQENAPSDIDAQLNRLQRRTASTSNQWTGSPLRNLEASSFGNMHFLFGRAVPVPVGDTVIFFQAGLLGLSTTGNSDLEGETDTDILIGGFTIGAEF